MLRKIIFAVFVTLVSPFSVAEVNCSSDLQTITISQTNDFFNISVLPGEQINITQNEQTFQVFTDLVQDGVVQVVFSPFGFNSFSLQPKLSFLRPSSTTVTITPTGNQCDVVMAMNGAPLPTCSNSNFSLVCLDSPYSAYPIKLKMDLPA